MLDTITYAGNEYERLLRDAFQAFVVDGLGKNAIRTSIHKPKALSQSALADDSKAGSSNDRNPKYYFFSLNPAGIATS